MTRTVITWRQGPRSVRPGMKFRDIGNVIQKHAKAHGFSVVKTYCGHGINRLFHTAPNVPHYAKNKAAGLMKVGNTFTIEPMINAGSFNDEQWPDGWTAVTVGFLTFYCFYAVTYFPPLRPYFAALC
uniref:Peptidase M24 domain-containing protein n=1 Tax=Parascaris equorum TaxID=6256 RepID=A0A914S6Y3_PAREQ